MTTINKRVQLQVMQAMEHAPQQTLLNNWSTPQLTRHGTTPELHVQQATRFYGKTPYNLLLVWTHLLFYQWLCFMVWAASKLMCVGIHPLFLYMFWFTLTAALWCDTDAVFCRLSKRVFRCSV